MKIRCATVALTLLFASAAFAAGEERTLEKKASDIIELRCTKCHTNAQINAAFTAGKDMNAIVEMMEKRGAKLSGNEKEVLGIFWKKKEPAK